MSQLVLHETRARRLVRLASYETRLLFVSKLIYSDGDRTWETVATRLVDAVSAYAQKIALPEAQVDRNIVTTIYSLAIRRELQRKPWHE